VIALFVARVGRHSISGSTDAARIAYWAMPWRAMFATAVPVRAWPAIHEAVEAGIRRTFAAGVRRLDTTVDVDFAAGIRWAAHLGFEPVAYLRRWAPGGRDHILFERLA
jgi:hypothetical protein